MTLLELTIAMMVVSVALVFLTGTIGALSNQRVINSENAVARAAAKTVIESMRASVFSQVWPRYNEDPDDDPGGSGSAPGSGFAVGGLTPVPGDADELVGEILFPTSTGVSGFQELREDVEDRALGLPRDLNGDSIVDASDHSDDYFILPVRVRIRWQGRAGERILDTYAQLCEFNKD